MSKNRAKDSNLAREEAEKDRSNSDTWNSVAEEMDNGAADIQDAWVKNWRKNN